MYTNIRHALSFLLIHHAATMQGIDPVSADKAREHVELLADPETPAPIPAVQTKDPAPAIAGWSRVNGTWVESGGEVPALLEPGQVADHLNQMEGELNRMREQAAALEAELTEARAASEPAPAAEPAPASEAQAAA